MRVTNDSILAIHSRIIKNKCQNSPFQYLLLIISWFWNENFPLSPKTKKCSRYCFKEKLSPIKTYIGTKIYHIHEWIKSLLWENLILIKCLLDGNSMKKKKKKRRSTVHIALMYVPCIQGSRIWRSRGGSFHRLHKYWWLLYQALAVAFHSKRQP